MLQYEEIEKNPNVDNVIKKIFLKIDELNVEKMTLAEYFKNIRPNIITMKKMLKNENMIISKEALLNVLRYCQRSDLFDELFCTNKYQYNVDIDILVAVKKMKTLAFKYWEFPLEIFMEKYIKQHKTQ